MEGTMDKQLAHVTFDRHNEWNHELWAPTLGGEMQTAWAEFIAALGALRL
jgi:hypothetical protein